MSLDPSKTLAFSPLHRLQWEDAQQKHVILYPEGMVELNVPSAEMKTRFITWTNGFWPY